MTFVFKVLRNRLLRYILETCPNLWWRSCSKCYAIDCFGTCPNLWWRSCSKCYAFDCFGTYLKHVQPCDDVRVQSATQSTASVHTWHMSKPVMTFVFQVLRNRLLRYMSKPVMTFVFKVLRIRLLRYILETCPTLWWRSCSKCYAIDCFGTYLKHVQPCDDVRVPSATQSTASVHAQTCDDVRVQSATHSTASVHTWNMSKPVMTFVFKVLRNRLLRYILDTCPKLWWCSCSKCYAFDCFGTYLKHVLGRVCSASLWNDVYLVHNDEILMGTAWFRARATKDPKRGCWGFAT